MRSKSKTDAMGTKEKLRERFLKMPSDFTFEEMQRLLEGYGYEKGNKGRTSGSRAPLFAAELLAVLSVGKFHCC